MATELQQLGSFLGSKFDDIYDGVVSVGDAALLNGQTADQIKNSTLNTIKDGVGADGDTLFKLRQLISGLQALVNGTDLDLDSIAEITAYIKANKDLIDQITSLKANKLDVYTKVEADDLLALKAVANEVYTKLETFSRSEITNKLSLKADTTDVNSGLDTKVNVLDVKGTISTENKVMTDNDVATAISGKADKTYVDAQIALQATINYVDAQLATKVNFTDVKSTITLDNKIMTQSDVVLAIAGKEDTLTVDSKLSLKSNTTDVQSALDTKVNLSDTVSPVTADNKVVTNTELVNGLNLKANASTTYSKVEVDAKETALNNADTALSGRITQIGSYAEFVAAFEATLV